MMQSSEFAVLRASTDLEAACHYVFHEGIDIMTNRGRGELSAGMLTVICVETFFGEVCNGGLLQYLTNQSATARACPDALRRVGLAEYAEIIEKALEFCTNNPSLDEFGEQEDEFDVEFESDDDFPLENLESRFFDLYFADEKKFRRQLFQYIAEHETEFVGRPKPMYKRADTSLHSNTKPLLSKADKGKARQAIRLDYNRKCREMNEQVERDGLPCPHCGFHTREFRFVAGDEDRDAYFICRKCSRSFGLSEMTS